MKLDKDLINAINETVKEITINGVISDNKCNSDLKNKSIRFLKERNFIKQSVFKKFQYTSSFEIHEINELGIEEFIKKQDRLDGLEIKIKELTIKNLELENKQLKRYVLYSIISFIAGAIITNLKDILNLLNLTNQ